MSAHLFSHRLPPTANAAMASHRELRQAMGALRVPALYASSPPEGHAFWGLLRDAVARLEAALLRHLHHEDDMHAMPENLRAELASQHMRLVVKTSCLGLVVERLAPGDEQGWQAMRSAAGRLLATLERHLDFENLLRTSTSA